MFACKSALKACFVAAFVALLADEIGEHLPPGNWVYGASLIVFGSSMAVAFITGCMAIAALLAPENSKS
jgi:hypothetical protein